jgi:hypothetical protein
VVALIGWTRQSVTRRDDITIETRDRPSDRWQLIMLVVFLLVIGVGVYVARHEGRIIAVPNPRHGAVAAKHRTNQSSRSGSPSAHRAVRAVPRTASSTGTDTLDASVDGLDDCHGEGTGEFAARNTPTPPMAKLRAAVALVDSDRSAAIGAMRALEGSALTDVYLSYLLHVAGNATEARGALRRARSALPADACRRSLQAEQDFRRSPVAVALRTLRLAIELSNDDPTEDFPLACTVFQTNPNEAVWAFGGLWGTRRDGLGSSMKRYCTKELVRRVVPGKELRVVNAESKICDALLGTRDRSESSTDHAIHVAACNIVRDVVLAPELANLFDADEAEKGLGEMSKDDPPLGRKIASYRGVVAAQAPVVAEGMCAILGARGKTADIRVCERLVHKASLVALYSWFSAFESPGR